MNKKHKPLQPDAPLFNRDHRRPRSRREFIAQGFMAGMGTVVGANMLNLFSGTNAAHALSSDLAALTNECHLNVLGSGKIPFICFDLAGGANTAGSNVLVGGRGGQLDFLSTAGYSKLGLPGDMIPAITNTNDMNTNDFFNTELGLAFHTDSAFLRGIVERTRATTRERTNGVVIPARSDNDTGNNPHNPLYAIHRAGAEGSLLNLIGSRNSDSGGNSMAPASMINPEFRPTKIDRPSDVTGLVDTGSLVDIFSQEDAVAVLESMFRISRHKIEMNNITTDSHIQRLLRCGYLKTADLAERFGDPSALDPEQDTDIVGDAGIFTQDELSSDGEFRKTASVMKLVIEGYAGAGCITMGGYDYHTGDRATGEVRDLRAGRCMGACLEYAARKGKPLMMYVFSDGSVASNGIIDESEAGRGKGVWTGDNSSTAAPFFLVYNPGFRPRLIGATPEIQAVHQQLGFMNSDASVNTSATKAARDTHMLVETVVLNYLALHGQQNLFDTTTLFKDSALVAEMDNLIAFEAIVSNTINNPAT
jgi:hypothetical protein